MVKTNFKKLRHISVLVLWNGLNNIYDDIVFDLFNSTDMLLHNYVQHVKYLPSVTKNCELYYSLNVSTKTETCRSILKLVLTKVIVFEILKC